MGVLKSILNSINGMWSELRELRKLQDPTNREKAEAFDKLNATLSKAQGSVRVRSVVTKVDKYGTEYIEVTYAPLVEMVYANRNGSTTSPLFKALNATDLVPTEDQMKIRGKMEMLRKKDSIGG